MKRNARTMVLVCSMFFLLGLKAQSEPVQPAPSQTATAPRKTAVSASEMKLRTTMTNLFIQCLKQQRTLAVRTLTGSQDTQKAQDNLTAALGKTGDVFKTYYGSSAGGQVTTLFGQFIQMTASYAAAVKKGGDKAAVVTAMHAKADELSNFLNSSSPVWTKSRLAEVLKRYSDASAAEIDMQGKSLGRPDTRTFSATFKECTEMAEIFAKGIARQFPNQFK